mgnify:CR=1 FL=1
MKKSSYIIAAIFICISISYFVQSHKLSRFRNLSHLQSVEIATLKDSVKTIVHKNGQLSFRIEAAQIDKKDLKNALEIAGFDIKTLKEREIQYRKINSILRARLEASGNISTSVRDTFRIFKTDTIRFQQVMDSSNGYLSIFDARIENQILDFNYRYKVSLDFFQETFKNNTVISVMLTDPNAEITSANSIIVTHKKKFYQKPWIWTVTGFTAGILIAK